MNSKRSRLTIGAALFAGTLLVISVTPAQAQTGILRVNIPFGFYAGEQQMPAGEYIVEMIANGAVKVANLDTHAAAAFLTFRVTNNNRAGSAKLVFNRYGDEHFLSEMWWTGQRDGLKQVTSKRELELAAVSTPVRIAVVRR